MAENETRIETFRGGLGISGIPNDHIRNANYRDQRLGRQEISTTDANVDRLWGGFSETDHPRNMYWDYFYTGQDVRVFIDGTENDPEFSDIPIVEIAWNMEQKKQPVFGFWSHCYDAVLRGSRIVNGAFSIVTKYPDYMTNVLRKAAASRAKNESSYRSYRDLTEDDSNIAKYWGKTMDPVIDSQSRHLFSIHPPFSLVVVYGVQSVSINSYIDNPGLIDSDMHKNQALYQDVNERLVDPDELELRNYTVIEACELTNVQKAIGPSGEVLIETYQFFARDAISPAASNRSARINPAFSSQTLPGGSASLPR